MPEARAGDVPPRSLRANSPEDVETVGRVRRGRQQRQDAGDAAKRARELAEDSAERKISAAEHRKMTDEHLARGVHRDELPADDGDE
jgi:hypothetical protein